MQVLGSQNYSPYLNNYLPPQSTPKKPLRYGNSPIQQQNFTRSEKKKPMVMKSKRSLPCDYPIEDFKQNHHNDKPYEPHDEVRNRVSNKHLQMAPFSSVVNTKGHNKIHEEPKATIKAYESETMKEDKKNQQAKSPRYEAKKYFEKMIQNKLNHMIQNKRKSASFRTNLVPKQQTNRPQKRKQSYHVHETRKEQNTQKVKQKTEKQERKPLQVNKQKSSLSFIIRKKINSNATESQRNYQKVGKNLPFDIQNIEKTEFIKSRNTQNHNETISKDTDNTSENHTITKYTYKPMEQQLKKLKERHYDKEVSVKPHHMKGMKCLKVRVNKVLKAQEHLFNEVYFGADKKMEQEKDKKQIHMEKQQEKIDRSREDQKIEIEQDIGRRLITIEEILQNKARQHQVIEFKQKIDHHYEQSGTQKSNLAYTQEQNKNCSVQPIVQVKTQESSLQQTRGQLKWKSYKETELQNHPQNSEQNRKRISSIRAIKNYYKKLDTEEKSSFISNDVKELNNNTMKKKQHAGCLTHKIKWGSSSRKKLDTDRVKVEGNAVEFSVDGIKQQKLITDMNPDLKGVIQAKLAVPTPKKRPVNKVEFLQEQFLRAKYHKTPKADKNLEKIFAQTINSKQLIDYDPIPFHIGSKSLIMFEDPGISIIVNNNNSIHSPTYPIGFNGEGPSQELVDIKNHDISPVAMIKKRAYDIVEEKEEEEHNPLESLQELYFELKSRKEILPKHNDEFAIESLQELCES